MNSSEAGLRFGMRLAMLGSRVRETSLARTMPGLVQQASRAVDAEAERRAQAAASQLVGWLEAHASTSPLPGAIGGLLGALGKLGGFLAQQVFGTAIGFGVGGALTGVLEPYFNDMTQAAYRANPSVILSPAELALGVLRGHVDQHRAEAEARSSGVTPDRFQTLIDNTGEPAATQDLMEAFRRGIIDRPRLERGIRQSRVRNEWIDVLEELRYSLMSPMQAIEGLVQGHVPEAEARRIAEQGGLLPAHFDPLFETAGNPPGMQDILELWNRGIVPESIVDQAYRESRYKPKYLQLYKELHRRLPPQRTVVAMVTQGVITPAQGVTKLVDLGYDQADAQALVNEGVARKTATTRDLAKGEIVAMYADREIPQAKASELLKGLGYDQSEADMLLALADHARERKYREAVVTRVHSSYVAGRLPEPRVRAILSTDGISGAQVDELLTLWDLERGAIVPAPSVPEHPELLKAEWQRLYRLGEVNETEFLAAMGRKGYGAEEARRLLVLAVPAARQRDLTTAQVQTLLRRGAVDRTEFHARLAEAGYDEADIAFLALLAFPPPPPPAGPGT